MKDDEGTCIFHRRSWEVQKENISFRNFSPRATYLIWIYQVFLGFQVRLDQYQEIPRLVSTLPLLKYMSSQEQTYQCISHQRFKNKTIRESVSHKL